jgi:hypothetical protein
VLAANESSDPAYIRIEDLQVCGIALTPEHPFGKSRHGLAVPAHQSSFRIKK